MDDQQSDERLKFPISELMGSLNTIVKKAQEKASIPEIGRYHVSMGLYSNRNDNRPTQSRYYYLTIDIYNKYDYEVISCSLDHLIGRIICNSYDSNYSKLFELPYSSQNSPILKGIKNKTLDILHYNLEEPTNRSKKYINIITEASMNLKNPIQKNPEINIYRSTYNNEFRYDDSRFEIEITWWYPPIAPKF
jgi:hypothetical protein